MQQTLPPGTAVALYRRVSTDEQARHGYSLRAQHEAQHRECQRRGWHIALEGQDDGVSAMSFERAGWNEMVASLAAMSAAERPRLLLVTKWSRFSRNMSAALEQIERLRMLGVEVQAFEQWINYSDPNHLYVLAINLVEPEVANRWLSVQVRQGMRRAMEEGRWVSKPPVGYRRVRDADDRAALAVCAEMAPLVIEAFERVAMGSETAAEVWRALKRRGLRIKRARFFKMIASRVYLGEVEIKAQTIGADYHGERVVTGRHEAIIDRRTWELAQLAIARRRRTGERGVKNSDGFAFPLRGHLMCPRGCGKVTASRSKGQGGRYGYYRCHKCAKNGHRPAFAARTDATEEAFEKYLRRVQISDEVARLFAEIARHEARATSERSMKERAAWERERRDIDARMGRADEMYVDGKLDRAPYDRLRDRSTRRLAELRELLDADSRREADDAERAAYAASVASRLGELWQRCEPEHKHALVGSIWPSGVIFDGEGFGTTPASPIIRLLTGKKPQNENDRPPMRSGRPLRRAREDSNSRPSHP